MLFGTGPSIFSKSPYEFAKERQRMRLSLPLMQQPVMYPPPRGFVRIRFLSSLDQTYKPPYFDFEAHFPLGSEGGLDLGVVKEKWGLESCVPIDPDRYRLFQPGKNDYLSPLAVHTLSQPRLRAISVTEPQVSRQTQVRRACRRAIVDVVDGITHYSLIAQRRMSLYIQYQTRLPTYYRAAEEKQRQLVSNYNRWYQDWEKKLGLHSVALVFLLFLLFLFYLFVRSGFVEFRLSDRLRTWFRTGRFALPERT